MRKDFPLIHKKIVVTSTYCLVDRSIRVKKMEFIRDNLKLCKNVFDDDRNDFSKWWHSTDGQKLEILIRKKFGYSPRTYVFDILNHFRWLYLEYLEQKPKRKK